MPKFAVETLYPGLQQQLLLLRESLQASRAGLASVGVGRGERSRIPVAGQAVKLSQRSQNH